VVHHTEAVRPNPDLRTDPGRVRSAEPVLVAHRSHTTHGDSEPPSERYPARCAGDPIGRKRKPCRWRVTMRGGVAVGCGWRLLGESTWRFLACRIGEVEEVLADTGVGDGAYVVDQGGPRWLGWRNRLR
jgi:hypothetical protein